MRAAELLEVRLAGGMLQARSCIHEPSIEEYETGVGWRSREVVQGHLNRPPGEGFGIDPREGGTVSREFFRNDAPARLFNHGVAAATQLLEQSGFAAAGVSRR